MICKLISNGLFHKFYAIKGITIYMNNNFYVNSNNKIEMKVDSSKSSLMHHKYMTIDNKIILTGSFNWT